MQKLLITITTVFITLCTYCQSVEFALYDTVFYRHKPGILERGSLIGDSVVVRTTYTIEGDTTPVSLSNLIVAMNGGEVLFLRLGDTTITTTSSFFPFPTLATYTKRTQLAFISNHGVGKFYYKTFEDVYTSERLPLAAGVLVVVVMFSLFTIALFTAGLVLVFINIDSVKRYKNVFDYYPFGTIVATVVSMILFPLGLYFVEKFLLIDENSWLVASASTSVIVSIITMICFAIFSVKKKIN